MNPVKWAGVAVIVAGVSFVGLGSAKATSNRGVKP